MPDTYTVKKDDNLSSISKKIGISLTQLKNLNPKLKSRIPPYGISAGDVLSIAPAQQKGDVKQTSEKCKKCITYQLTKPKPFLIAKAVASNIFAVTKIDVKVTDDDLHGEIMPLGQDITHSYGESLLKGYWSASDDEDTLRAQMLGLLDVFASNDTTGTARKLFNKFLEKNSEVTTFFDEALNKEIEASANFAGYPGRTLGAPGTGGADPKKPRVHQLLKNAGWDINKIKLIEDLGVPAFNNGNKSAFSSRNTGDWANGLAVMINGVQYVYVYIEKYSYDSCKEEYEIDFKFVLYDVFGLDDDDVRKFGISGVVESTVAACQGITAWWQLQHQFNYAPVLTRAVVRKTFKVPTSTYNFFGVDFP